MSGLRLKLAGATLQHAGALGWWGDCTARPFYYLLLLVSD